MANIDFSAAWPAAIVLLVVAVFVALALWKFFSGKKSFPAGDGSSKPGFFSGISGFFLKAKEKKLFERKRQLMQELEVAEHKFMKREIQEENYKNLVRKKQQELIKIDIALSKHAQKENILQSDLEGVEPKQRHLLKEILGEKQKAQEEMQLAQTRYLKRKIDEKTYQSIINSCQSKLIELDGQAMSLRASQQIKNAFSDLKEKLAEEQKSLAQKEQAEIHRIANEILEQVEKPRSK